MSSLREHDQGEAADASDNSRSSAIPLAKINCDPRTIQSVDPSQCRVWPLHPRSPERINYRSCHSLIKSIAAHGQLMPGLGRPIRNDPDRSVEILCGSRRLFAARHLGIPLLVQVRDLSNWECALVVEIENRIRQGLSRAERDIYFKTLIDQGLGHARAGPPRLKDYDVIVRTQDDRPLFTSRSYFNVLEFVFPRSLDNVTIERIKSAVAESLDPHHPITSSSRSAN